MFSKIVVAFNDLPESQRALRTSIYLARLCNAEVTTVTILGYLRGHAPFSIVLDPQAPVAMMEERRNRHTEMHEKAANLARDLGVLAQGAIVLGDELPAILDFAKDKNTASLVVGLHQHGFSLSGLLNSIYDLAHDADCSVLGVHRARV
jgi:nucleotide-binding universal stress UspA family protein